METARGRRVVGAEIRTPRSTCSQAGLGQWDPRGSDGKWSPCQDAGWCLGEIEAGWTSWGGASASPAHSSLKVGAPAQVTSNIYWMPTVCPGLGWVLMGWGLREGRAQAHLLRVLDAWGAAGTEQGDKEAGCHQGLSSWSAWLCSPTAQLLDTCFLLCRGQLVAVLLRGSYRSGSSEAVAGMLGAGRACGCRPGEPWAGGHRVGGRKGLQPGVRPRCAWGPSVCSVLGPPSRNTQPQGPSAVSGAPSRVTLDSVLAPSTPRPLPNRHI